MGPLKPLAGRRVGVYGSGGAPWHHLALAARHGAEVAVVRAGDVRAGRLAALDALVVPGGGATAMAGLLAPLGEDGARTVRAWVEAGGAYVSSCAGSVLPLALDGAADEALPLARHLRMVEVPLANRGDATLGGLATPGVGRIEVRVDPSHPYAAGLPETLPLIHYNGPFFDVAAAPAEVRSFAWPRAASDAFTPGERFLPGDTTAPTVFDRCVAAGAATGLEVPVGRGRAVLFGSHPEFGLGPLGLGWGDGSRLLVAALAGPPRAAGADDASRPASSPEAAGVGAPLGWEASPERPDTPPGSLARDVAGELARAAGRFDELAATDPGAWLDPEHAPAFHGRTARRVWSTDAAAAATAARAAAHDLAPLADLAGDAERPWLDDAPGDDQDFGAMGLLQLVGRLHASLDAAERGLTRPPRRPAHAYDLFGEHPYHLAVASYLSAAGLAAGAALQVAVIAARVGAATPELDAVL